MFNNARGYQRLTPPLRVGTCLLTTCSQELFAMVRFLVDFLVPLSIYMYFFLLTRHPCFFVLASLSPTAASSVSREEPRLPPPADAEPPLPPGKFLRNFSDFLFLFLCVSHVFVVKSSHVSLWSTHFFVCVLVSCLGILCVAIRSNRCVCHTCFLIGFLRLAWFLFPRRGGGRGKDIKPFQLWLGCYLGGDVGMRRTLAWLFSLRRCKYWSLVVCS